MYFLKFREEQLPDYPPWLRALVRWRKNSSVFFPTTRRINDQSQVKKAPPCPSATLYNWLAYLWSAIAVKRTWAYYNYARRGAKPHGRPTSAKYSRWTGATRESKSGVFCERGSDDRPVPHLAHLARPLRRCSVRPANALALKITAYTFCICRTRMRRDTAAAHRLLTCKASFVCTSHVKEVRCYGTNTRTFLSRFNPQYAFSRHTLFVTPNLSLCYGLIRRKINTSFLTLSIDFRLVCLKYFFNFTSCFTSYAAARKCTSIVWWWTVVVELHDIQ